MYTWQNNFSFTTDANSSCKHTSVLTILNAGVRPMWNCICRCQNVSNINNFLCCHVWTLTLFRFFFENDERVDSRVCINYKLQLEKMFALSRWWWEKGRLIKNKKRWKRGGVLWFFSYAKALFFFFIICIDFYIYILWHLFSLLPLTQL